MKPEDIKLELNLRKLEYRKQLDPKYNRMVAEPIMDSLGLHRIELQSVLDAMEVLGPRLLIPGVMQCVIKCDLFEAPDMTSIRAAFTASNAIGMFLGVEPIWDDVHEEVFPAEDVSALVAGYWGDSAVPDANMVTLFLRISYNLWLVL